MVINYFFNLSESLGNSHLVAELLLSPLAARSHNFEAFFAEKDVQ